MGPAELTLRIERSGGEYRVLEAGSGATSSLAAMEILPLLPEENSKRHWKPRFARTFGQQLFATLFQYEILARFTAAREAARSAGKTLRLRLDLERAEELEGLPWELLAEPGATSCISLVRSVPTPTPSLAPALLEPLRILAVLASPADPDLPPFDRDREWEILERALQDPIRNGRAFPERLKEASEAGLRQALARQRFQVLHFVGYGRSNLRAQHGSLFLEDQARHSRAINADYLAGLLGQHPAAHLAVLNEGGSADELNPFAQTARVLARNGLSAVIAMRRRLSGEATVIFHRELYSSLASRLSIEQSVVNARRALAQRTLEVEWDAPMLYLSSENRRPLESASPVEIPRNTRDLMGIRVPSRPATSSDREQTAAAISAIVQRKIASQQGQDELGDRSGLRRRNVRKTKILILAASPENLTRLRLAEEIREIDAGLRRARYRQRFQLEHRQAVRPLDLQQAMLDIEPQIVHFCGHGAGHGGLILEDNNGRARPVPTSALANLFGLFSDKIECVVLNSCHSEHQAKAISQHVPYVVGMKAGIGDRAAISFATGFYCALGAGQPIDFAYYAGRSAIELEDLPDHLTPILLAGRGIEPLPDP